MVLEGGRWRLADDGFAGTFLLAEHKALASPKTSVLVPDVTGMPASVASIELFGANLVAQPEGPSTDRAGGVVVQQSVAPGTPVARGSTIRLSATP
jgi:beta-lactam-binding protein with PASTA domain